MLPSQELTDLKQISGIGPVRLAHLAQIGIFKPRDLIYRFPKHYIFKQKQEAWPQAIPSHDILLEAVVTGKSTIWRRGRQSIVRLPVQDAKGNIFTALWFNQPYRHNQFLQESTIWIEGKAQMQNQKRVMLVKKCGFGLPNYGLEAVYDLPPQINQSSYRKWLKEALTHLEQLVPEFWPEHWQDKIGISLPEALRQIHFPKEEEELSRAQKRLLFDETLLLQLMQQNKEENRAGFAVEFSSQAKTEWLKSLPFSLTQAQKRCLQEIEEDLKKPVPMSRFLQGDVGSGKTVVAAGALLAGVLKGYQCALLAPTEILARQHAESLKGIIPKDIKLYLLTGKQSNAEKRLAYEQAEAGERGIWIGTHALLSEGLDLPNLSLLVIDEQHRFGVMQRQKLLEGRRPQPDLLALSATPIPRSLALLLYGDMQISVLDELPPNRLPIKTLWLQEDKRVEKLMEFTGEEMGKGHSIYWVCPSIKQNEDEDYIMPSLDRRKPILDKYWPTNKWALLHGQMKIKERQEVMENFEKGLLQGLLATTVVEVGVDQPKATVMVVEGADRFGLAQLHQLRGRVGRSDLPSYCALITGDKVTATAEERLKALCHSQDGFYLAQLDLELRGPGEILGTNQSGFSELLVFRWQVDEEVLELTKSCFKEWKEGSIRFSPQEWESLIDRFNSCLSARRGG